jgi:ABC-2 type transport system permease protein
MGAILFELLKLLAIDLVFVGILTAVMVPLAAYKKAAFAVLKRNFVGYFSNPTGYVFLCIFVLLTAIAAFWPHEFFVANLANLDQLNIWFPWIMLVFIPAITMSIWSEERRQGTDELLLTLPAGDFDIVFGKYLAAAAIYTVSLIFSQLAAYSVLVSLTLDPETRQVDLDTGLIFTTYFGYWLMGLAMLAIGMIASFLTNNLTVSFILGLIFNSILVITFYADRFVPSSATARQISRWSFASQFDDFGRGVVSLSSTAFFLLITALGVYLSMVLIGKRHWSGGRDGQSLWWHYLLRAIALVVVLVGVNMVLERYDYLRFDCTSGQVSSLSSDTKKLLRGLELPDEQEQQLQAEAAKLDKTKDKEKYDKLQKQIADLAARRSRPITIDAYISANVPDEYVKTRYNLVSMLKELERQAGSRVHVNLHDNLEPFSEQAAQAEERFGIKRQTVVSRARGQIKEEEFILGAAFTSGLEKVVVPFFGNGVPVEYELIRSIATVGRGERKKLGIVNTDAQLSGGFTFAGMQPRQIPKQLIVEEFEKQYKVEEVDPTNPIEPGKYDVLLVVQPSSLGPQQLANVSDAVRKGQPAAIFEDPFPYVMNQVVGTAEEKPPQGGMFGMGGQPQPKGDIRALWDALGIQVTGDTGRAGPAPGTIVWQDYNPYPKFQMRGIGPELVFIRNDAPGAKDAFNPKEEVSSGFDELLMPYPTGIAPQSGSQLKFTELVSTSSTEAGTIDATEWRASASDPYLLNEKRGKPTGLKYTLAAWIRTEDPTSKDGKTKDAKKDKDAEKPAGESSQPKVNAIYIGDIDMLHSEFVMLRNQPNPEINFRFDNVAFVLNVIDAVAGDTRFLDIRKRKPRHSTLKTIEARSAEARDEENKQVAKFQADYTAATKKADDDAKKTYAELQKVVDDLRQKQSAGQQVDPGEMTAKLQTLSLAQENANRKSQVVKERLKTDRDKALARIQRERDQQIQQIQNEYKVWAAVIPPIPPLLVGLLVWVYRRLREREGVSRERMK